MTDTDVQVTPRFNLGDLVQKKANSKWRGVVVGFYETENTPIGYSVKSLFETGSVQVWPEAALIPWDGEGTPAKLEADNAALRNMVATQAEEAAKAATAYAEGMAALRAENDALREEIEVLATFARKRGAARDFASAILEKLEALTNKEPTT
jgi:hypothetical protein